MEKNDKIICHGRYIRIYVALSFVLSLICTALRCASMLLFYDSDIGYYSADVLLPVISNAFTAVSVIALAVVSFIIFRLVDKNKKEITPRSERSLGMIIASGIGALGFLGVAVDALLNSAGDFSSSVFVVALSLCACLYFAFDIIGKGSDMARIGTGISVILSVLLILANVYFDITVPMNSSDKTFIILGCASVMLFTVCDMRARVSTPRPALYAFSLGGGAIIMLTSSVPSVMACALGIIEDKKWAYYYGLFLCIFVYLAVKMIYLCRRCDCCDEEGSDAAEFSEKIKESISEEISEASGNVQNDVED